MQWKPLLYLVIYRKCPPPPLKIAHSLCGVPIHTELVNSWTVSDNNRDKLTWQKWQLLKSVYFLSLKLYSFFWDRNINRILGIASIRSNVTTKIGYSVAHYIALSLRYLTMRNINASKLWLPLLFALRFINCDIPENTHFMTGHVRLWVEKENSTLDK